MNMSFWPTLSATSGTTFTTYLSAAVTNRALSTFDGVAGTNFAGTPWMKGLLVTQDSVNNIMKIIFPAGIFAAQGIEVSALKVLQMRLGLRTVTTNEFSAEGACFINTDSANVAWQNTFVGGWCNVGGAPSFRRGFVGGQYQHVVDDTTYIVSSFSIDVSVNSDAGCEFDLGASTPTNMSGTSDQPQPINERVLFITRLFED